MANFNSFIQPHSLPYGQDPNNPDPGQFDVPNSTPDNGSSSPPASKPVTVPSGRDYTGWNWEQTLVGVLGLALPSRTDVTTGRWTVINFNSPGGTGMYRIYAATWTTYDALGAPHKDTFVYLNPNLLTPGGVWDNYFFQPATAIQDAQLGNYTLLQADPRTFADAAAGVQGVIDFYYTTNKIFWGISNAVSGDASAFKGQAGGAFARLMNNLYQVSNSAYTALTNPNYAQAITTAGNQVEAFLTSLYNAIARWSKMLDHSPLGAIYQALLDEGVMTGSDGVGGGHGDGPGGATGGGGFRMVNPNSSNSPFGDLTTAAAWLNVEAAAKQLWTTSVVQALDLAAQTALNALATAYLTTAGEDQPLPAPTLAQITAGAANANPNLNTPGGGNPNLNTPGGANPNVTGPGGGGNPNLNVPGGGNPNLNTPGGGNPNVTGPGGGALNALGNNPGGAGNLNIPGGVNPNVTGPGGASTPQLQTALGGTGATQSALQGALSLAPATGPLHNAITTALGDNAKTAAALQAGLNGSTSPAAALQAALASNAQTQAALRQALALAPPRGPLHNALEAALHDANRTQNKLNHALANGSIPGSTPIHQALNSDAALNGALHKALNSAQVPSHGPLHNALTNAIAQSGHVRSALDQALSATPNTSALNHALSSNNALEADLRKALAEAPAKGPLHNELMAALADSKNIGTQIHQALAQAGVAAEPAPGVLSSGVGNPTAGLGSLSQGLTQNLGPSTGTLAVAGAPVSSGQFVPQAAAGTSSGTANGTSAVPFFPPMAGGMGMGMGGQQGNQERERTTWLTEDEEVWGTDPPLAPAVLGRDVLDDEDDFDSYDKFGEPAALPERDTSRTKAR
jgi:hypothetical protein